ncbi:MarR family winged helix-turn-helix transcriptional regulator [Glutamicibacter arilaitensis]|uniref:MarR family winged helix-turn-helix transcriptional regulator n=1 Tax=Glutamicibacter arilaitensis TaxID=256701 RepID=UPI003850680D
MSTSRGTPPSISQTLPGFLPGDLGWHLGMILRGHQLAVAQSVAPVPGQVRGYQLLSTVVHRDPANQQALGSHLGIDRTVLTYLIDDLVEAQLVERIAAPSDRRARKIIATARGEKLLAELEVKVNAAEQELLTGLSDTQSAQLAGLISTLSANIHNAQPGANPCEAMDLLG